jgi:hypothetical protein
VGISQKCISAIALTAVACGPSKLPAKKIEPVYDRATGKLQLLKYDSNGNGKFDTFSYMDGSRVVRIEIDQDENGTIDRWEYYDDTGQKLVKVGFSRAQDGKEDAWSYFGPDGAVDRIEVSTNRDGKISRVEHYAAGRMTAAEEDTDGDGHVDKWETYDGDRLAAVAFDTQRRGAPDRRLVYHADGSSQLEVDDTGGGRFVAAPAASAPSRSPR